MSKREAFKRAASELVRGACPETASACTTCEEYPASICGVCHKQAIEEAVDYLSDDRERLHCRGCLRQGPEARACPGVPAPCTWEELEKPAREYLRRFASEGPHKWIDREWPALAKAMHAVLTGSEGT